MYKLYWAQDTGAMAPQILLEEVGADYAKIVLDLDAGDQRGAAYLALNPRGQVPTLLLPDGEIMTESAAIAIHLAESHPEADLLPPPASSARARVLRWLCFAVANLYDADLRIYYSDEYSTDPDCAASIRARARLDLDRYWDLLEAELGDGPYLLGERYSIIDPYLLMIAWWHERVDELFARCPRLARLCSSVQSRPACRKVWPQHHPWSP